MSNRLSNVVVTGASGFVGRNFVISVHGKYRLFCIARRSQKEAGIAKNEYIHWLQADITNWDNLLQVIKYIKIHGGADYFLHLAGYYEFTMDENPAYELANVIGTRYLLDMSKMLEIKRFIFSSSLAACRFPRYGKKLTEKSPAGANFPYARSKKRGEEIIKQYSNAFPCSIVRLAAVYSDWCEYPMLYMLLKSWLSKTKLISRIVAGKGESAIPYIHIKDLVKLFLRIIEISDTLPQLAIYNASPQGCVSQNELYKTATRYYYGRDIKPFRIPKLLTALGLILISFLNRLRGKEPLEKLWMWKYVDKQLNIDATWTYNALGWKPTPRYHILRRLLFLTEKMISHPNNWTYRNEALLRRVAFRKSTTITDILTEMREPLVTKIAQEVMKPGNVQRFPNYRTIKYELLQWYITLSYQLVATTVRNRDRSVIPHYVQAIAYRYFSEGFKAMEVRDLMLLTGEIIKEALLARPELKGAKQRVDDYIILTSRLAADECEDAFELFQEQLHEQYFAGNTIELLAKKKTSNK